MGRMVGNGSYSKSLAPLAAQAQVNASASGKPPEFSRQCDPRRFRALFPDAWPRFLQAHFRDATEVAYFFSVDPKTGRDWWEGTSGSQGWAVAYAVKAIPGAGQYLVPA